MRPSVGARLIQKRPGMVGASTSTPLTEFAMAFCRVCVDFRPTTSTSSNSTRVPHRSSSLSTAALEALQELQHQGKVRYIGISGTIPNLRDQIAMGVFDVFQIPYSALQLEHEELMADASNAGAGIVIRGGAARGGPAKESGDAWSTWKAAGMDDLIGDMDRMEFVLRFTYSSPDLDTTIVGTLNPDHLQQNIDALMKGPLPPDLYDEAKRRLASAQ